MKKISSIVLAVLVLLIPVSYCYGESSNEKTAKEFLEWTVMPYGEYQMIDVDNSNLLDIQVWTLANYIHECVARLSVSDFTRPNTFILGNDELDKFALATIDSKTLLTLFSNENDAQKISLKISLMAATISRQISEKNLLVAFNGDNHVNKPWFEEFVLTLYKCQVTLDKGLYLPENNDEYTNLWN